MARKHSFTVLLGVVTVTLICNGCALLKDAASRARDDQPVATYSKPDPANPDQPASEPDEPKISVKVRQDSSTQTLQFDGPYATLGDVLSKAEIKADPAKTVAVHRNTNVIYMPSYFATSTDAAKIAIEDDDEVAFIDSSSSPLATNKLTSNVRATLRKAFPSIFPKNVTPTIDLLNDAIETWNDEIASSPNDVQLRSSMQKFIDKANSIKTSFKKEMAKEGVIGKYAVSGLIQNPGTRALNDVKTMDEIVTNEVAIVNRVPANIIVLQRGNTFSILPFRDALRTGTVPANVMSAATKSWTEAVVLNGDTYQFNRLALFAPILDGIKKEAERKASKRLANVAKNTMKNAESYFKEVEKQSRRKEPSGLQKALRSLPNQLPDLKIPGIRLPGF